MFCYCNDCDTIETYVLDVRVEIDRLGYEYFIKTIKDTVYCNDCGSIFDTIYEIEEID